MQMCFMRGLRRIITAGAVIVMDNASFHKRADILESIAQTSCTLKFLPPYSPDLNPIRTLMGTNKGHSNTISL